MIVEQIKYWILRIHQNQNKKFNQFNLKKIPQLKKRYPKQTLLLRKNHYKSLWKKTIVYFRIKKPVL